MTKRQKCVTFGTMVLAGAIVTVVLVVILRKEQDVISLREARRRTENLKKEIAVPIDEATRQRIDRLTNDLAGAHKFVEYEGKMRTVATIAKWELSKVGRAALPQLIDAAQNHDDPVVRQYALGVISSICREQGAIARDFLPVFVRSTWDENAMPRGAAVAAIGTMAQGFYRDKDQEAVDQLIPYLVRAVGDEDESVQGTGAEFLYGLGRADLLTKEVIEKYGIGIGT